MGNDRDVPARMAIPLAFLYTRNRSSVDGATRFQKLVFLAQEESGLPKEYDYRPDNFGPFSAQLHSDIYRLADQGYVEKKTEVNGVGNPVHVFRITRKGILAAKEFAKRDTTGRIFDSAEEIKKSWGDTRIDDLIRYVYNSYDDYTTESELDISRLKDRKAESQFLESDDSDDYIGPGPGEWKELNPSADELFSID